MRILSLIIVLVISSNLLGQELSGQYNISKDLFEKEEYYDAVTEFKRLIFFDSSGEYHAESEFFIGVSYKAGGFYNEAIQYLSSAVRKTRDPKLVRRGTIEIVKANILRRTTTRAMQILGELDKGSVTEEDKNEVNLLRGFALVFEYKLEEAVNYFRLAGFNDLADLTQSAKDAEYSETKARIMSVFIPGAGQIYAGNYLNGIISLALNGISVYLTIQAFNADRIFDGIMIGNFLWYRFYSGNIYNAGKFAGEKNRDIYYNYLKILQDYKSYKLF
jgi:tetratricopeptide (TPR) repeat protein